MATGTTAGPGKDLTDPPPRKVRPMRDVVICEPVRTPIGRYGGVFKNVTAVDLGAQALRGLLERTGLDPAEVDDVILGHCNGNSEAPAIGRVVALDAGLPVTVPGQHLDRRCGSGLQSVLNAVMGVLSGAQDLVVAGGVESMSNAVFYSTDMRWGGARGGIRVHDGLVRARETAGGSHYPVPGGMIETAETLRAEYGIPRSEQDELAVASHARAVAAQHSGVYAEEIVPVAVRGRKGDTVVDTDEHPRADTTLESLSGLKPIMGAQNPDATVTAGNASGQNDAAALCVVTTRDRAAHLGLRPLIRLRTWAAAGVAPKVMGIGPVPATARALEQAGLDLADIDVIELNEAFAAQALAVMREWKFTAKDLERTNVHGSGISLGHPVGATGTRMVGTLARELDRSGGRYGLATMCIGGGQGLAAVFEAVDTR
ncbi:acetyl-CoA C-acetyltransferase [Nocardiopsis oceani]